MACAFGIVDMRPDKRNWWDCVDQSLLMTASEPFKSQDCPTWQLSAGAVFKGDWMHYYPFHIGDYASHTAHLDEIEDLAYRRMLDYCYLNEIGLPETVEEVARLIRMRTHSERIANVLREFFTLHDDGIWRHSRVEGVIAEYNAKSGKAQQAARKRWENAHANAMRTHSERNANQNQEPITNNQLKDIGDKSPRQQFKPPTLDDVTAYVTTREVRIDPQRFIDHYTANGWKVGRNPMKDWQACVRTWEKRDSENTGKHTQPINHTRRLSRLDEARQARERARDRHNARASDMGGVDSHD